MKIQGLWSFRITVFISYSYSCQVEGSWLKSFIFKNGCRLIWDLHHRLRLRMRGAAAQMERTEAYWWRRWDIGTLKHGELFKKRKREKNISKVHQSLMEESVKVGSEVSGFWFPSFRIKRLLSLSLSRAAILLRRSHGVQAERASSSGQRRPRRQKIDRLRFFRVRWATLPLD